MRVKLAYGEKGLEITLPDSVRVEVIEPGYLPGLADPEQAVTRAFRAPTGTLSLRELAGPGDRVGIAVSDITRPMPYSRILPPLLHELRHLPPEQIRFFVATGTHRPNTSEELRSLLGSGIVDRYRIVQNDASAPNAHVTVGTTRSGNRVKVLREFAQCSVRIATGFIEPHFFAGCSGGGKAVIPGLAALETIMHNHSAAHLDSPGATWGVTRGNPLWEDLQEAAELVGVTFLLNVTLNRDKEVTAVFAGDLKKAHEKGCAFVREHAMVPVPHAYDVVMTSNSGSPLDLNLYQCVKGMSAAAQVVKPGGSILMAAHCRDGIPDHGEYGRMLKEAESLASLLEKIRSPGYHRQDMWQVHVQARVCDKAHVHVYSENLTDTQIRSAFLTPCRDIPGWVAAQLDRFGRDTVVCVLPEGPQTIPCLDGAV